MTREEVAMRLLDAMEATVPELVHYFNPFIEDLVSAHVDLEEIVLDACKPWSLELYHKGEYSPERSDRELDDAQRYRDLLPDVRRRG